MCHYLATKINKDAVGASDSSMTLCGSDEDIVEVIEEESDTESDEGGKHIGDT